MYVSVYIVYSKVYGKVYIVYVVYVVYDSIR